MARQNIGIGAAPNDDTGDSLRVGADKANDNFIELYSMFDVWPGNFNYWPLGGAAELTGAVTIDGNDHDLIIGFPNSLDDFSVFVNNAIVIDALSGTDQASINMDPLNGINFDVSSPGSSGSFIINQSGSVFGADNGVESSDITIAPDAFHLHVVDTGGSHYHMDVGITTGLSLISDDGVDSSSLSLTPTSSGFAVGSSIIGLSPTEATIQSDSILLLGEITLNNTLQLQSYNVAGLPSAANQGKLVYVANESGGPVPAFSDGTDWRRVTDGNIVS